MRTAQGQLTISTTGILPSSPLSRSIILGDRQGDLAAQWSAPVNASQQLWVNRIKGRANQSASAGLPANFTAAAADSSIAESAGLRFAMTGNVADLNKTVGVLLNAALPAQNSNDFITHTELLSSYLSAYDFVRGASTTDLSAATRSAIESRLQGLAQNLSYGNNTDSNARAKIGATKALAGELFGNQTLLNAGLNDLQLNFNYSTTDDGWYADSQSVYLDYTLRHLGLFARAYEQGSGVNIYDDLQPLLDLSLAMRKPDGAVPGVSNGLNWPVATQLFTNNPDADAAGRMLWNFNQLPVNAFDETNIENNDYSTSSQFALTNFNVPAPAPTQSPTFLATGQSAISVFRHDWSATSDYLMLSPGIDSPAVGSFGNIYIPAFHSSNDTGEILLSSGGQYLLVGGGYNRTDLPNYPAGFQSQAANNHNVVLVDGGLGRTNEGRVQRPEDFVHTDRLDSTERGGFRGVGDFATLQTEYGGAEVSRSIGFANEDYFVVADRMASASTHAYGFNLIGRGTRTVLTDTSDLIQVKWEHNGQQAIEHLVSTHAMSLTTASTYMHDQFGVYEQTQRMTATMSAANAGFVSILETGPAGSASRLMISDLSTPDYAALKAAHVSGNFEDWVLSQSTNALRSLDVFSTDAQYAYVRHVGGALESAMLARATLLTDGETQLFAADHALTLSLLFGDESIRGTVSNDLLVAGTELQWFGRTITSVWLNGSPLSFYNEAGNGRFELPTGGALRVEFSAVPEPASLALLGLGAAACWLHRGRRVRANRK